MKPVFENLSPQNAHILRKDRDQQLRALDRSSTKQSGLEKDVMTLERELEASRRVNECLVEEVEEKGHQLEEAQATARQLSNEVNDLRNTVDTTFCKIDTAQVLEGPRTHFTKSLERGLDTSLIDEEKKRNNKSLDSKLPLTSLARLAVQNPTRVDKSFVEPYVLRYIVPFADSCQALCENRNDLVHPAAMLVDRRRHRNKLFDKFWCATFGPCCPRGDDFRRFQSLVEERSLEKLEFRKEKGERRDRETWNNAERPKKRSRHSL